MGWADNIRKLKVRTNSETPLDTKTARDFGAEGIGLCRTEHMFFDEERILSVREMILSKTQEDRAKALDKLLHIKEKILQNFQSYAWSSSNSSCLTRHCMSFYQKQIRKLQKLQMSWV